MRVLGSLLWLAALLPALAGCDTVTTVRGTVKDPDGRALAAAVCTLSEPGGSAVSDTTGADGSFDLFKLHTTGASYLDFSVAKEGFASHAERVAGGEDHVRRVVLEPTAGSLRVPSRRHVTPAEPGVSVVPDAAAPEPRR